MTGYFASNNDKRPKKQFPPTVFQLIININMRSLILEKGKKEHSRRGFANEVPHSVQTTSSFRPSSNKTRFGFRRHICCIGFASILSSFFHGKKVRLLYILNKRRSFALHYATTPIQMATALPKLTNNRVFLLGCSIHGLTGHGGLR